MVFGAVDRYKSMPVVVKASIWFVICAMLQKSISFITTPVFTRIMSTEQFGIYNTYLSWLQIFIAICTLNMHSGIYVNSLAKSDNEKQGDIIAISLLSLSFVITSALFIVYLLFRNVINELTGMQTGLFVLMFAELMFMPALNMWTVKQRFRYKYAAMIVVTLLTTIMNAGLGIWFVMAAEETRAGFARILSIAMVQVIVGGVCWIYYVKKSGRIFSVREWKHALKMQIPLVPHGLSITVLSSSDKIMINSLVGASAAGLYSVAYSVALVTKTFKDCIVEAVKPWVYKKIREKKIYEVEKMIKSITLAIFAMEVFIMLLAPEVIYVMGGKKYAEAVYIIPPVIASVYFTFVYNVLVMFEMYYEKVMNIMTVSIICAVLNIVTNYIFIPIFGYIAAGYTTLFCFMIFCIAHYFPVRKICDENYDGQQVISGKFLILVSVCVLCITAAVIALYSFRIIRYVIIVGLMTVIAAKRRELAAVVKQIKEK